MAIEAARQVEGESRVITSYEFEGVRSSKPLAILLELGADT